jgi:hypothetical protein
MDRQLTRDIVDAKAQMARTRRLIEDFERQNERDERDAQERRAQRLRETQAFADDCFEPHGFRAPAPSSGENLTQFKRRLMYIGQSKLPPGDERRSVRIVNCADDAINALWPAWMKDVAAAGRDPDLVPEGEIYSSERTDSSGHRITEFRGRDSFVKQLGRKNMRVVAFNRGPGGNGAFPR